MSVKLRYIGGGATFTGVPARDLTTDDLEKYAAEIEHNGSVENLVASGLYERAEQESRRARREAPETMEVQNADHGS